MPEKLGRVVLARETDLVLMLVARLTGTEQVSLREACCPPRGHGAGCPWTASTCGGWGSRGHGFGSSPKRARASLKLASPDTLVDVIVLSHCERPTGLRTCARKRRRDCTNGESRVAMPTRPLYDSYDPPMPAEYLPVLTSVSDNHTLQMIRYEILYWKSLSAWAMPAKPFRLVASMDQDNRAACTRPLFGTDHRVSSPLSTSCREYTCTTSATRN